MVFKETQKGCQNCREEVIENNEAREREKMTGKWQKGTSMINRLD